MLRRSYSVFICNYLTCLSLILLIQHLPGTSCSGKQKYAAMLLFAHVVLLNQGHAQPEHFPKCSDSFQKITVSNLTNIFI